MNGIRNVAIIAHVDHGKTTLVDALLRGSKTRLHKDLVQQDLIMDSNELERERGITIFSKNASVQWNGIKINIIDTPGHADFGGEVERVLTMADGCLLVVDAKEGPMPQTRFVLKKALEMKHRIIVVINKIDKPDARPDYVLDKTFDLFVELGADHATLDFPIIYSSAKQGKAGLAASLDKMTDIAPIFETILQAVPPPAGNPQKPLQMIITALNYDNFKGRIATGKIVNGEIKSGQEIAHINRQGQIKKYRLTSLMTFAGLDRVEVQELSSCGDIAALAGIPDITIGDTVADPLIPEALPLLQIEEPTVKIVMSINDSPFAGREGKFCTTRQIRQRLLKELETDMALRVEDGLSGSFVVSGRGELHLAILLERLRREGYEFQVARPQVVTREIDGKTLVPYERVWIETPEKFQGAILQKLGSRHGQIQDLRAENGISYLEFIIPTKGLMGYRSEFLVKTRGLGIFNSTFLEYRDNPGSWPAREQGSLIACESGVTNSYGILNVQDRGTMFLGPGIEVYKGQVVGQNSRSEDIRVNVCKIKQLSNMRSKGEGSSEHLNTPLIMDLERSLEYIGDDELVEITPLNIRIRKKYLDERDAKKQKLAK